MDSLPSAPRPGSARPSAGWHETAAMLTGGDDDDGGPAAVRALLEHAAAGLLCPPAAAGSVGQLTRLLVDQAVAELAEVGVTCPPPADAGTARVHLADVRPVLAAAATRLPACTSSNEEDLLAYARAALFTRQALDAAAGG